MVALPPCPLSPSLRPPPFPLVAAGLLSFPPSLSLFFLSLLCLFLCLSLSLSSSVVLSSVFLSFFLPLSLNQSLSQQESVLGSWGSDLLTVNPILLVCVILAGIAHVNDRSPSDVPLSAR